MKKMVGLLLILLSFGITSCSSDDSNNNQGGLYLRFTYNGQNYDYEPETITSLVTSINGTEGVDATYKFLSLTLPNDVTEGTYSITSPDPSDLEAFNAYYNSEGDAVDFDASSGTITITNIDSEYITGTFSFSGDNNGTTITITNGSFRAYK